MLDEESIYERSLAAGRVKIFAYRVTCVAQVVSLKNIESFLFIIQKKSDRVFIILDMNVQH